MCEAFLERGVAPTLVFQLPKGYETETFPLTKTFPFPFLLTKVSN